MRFDSRNYDKQTKKTVYWQIAMFPSFIFPLLCFHALTAAQFTHARVGVCETIADDYLDLIMKQGDRPYHALRSFSFLHSSHTPIHPTPFVPY